MIALGIITAPRPRPTLCASHDHLRMNARYRGVVHIFAEPGVEDVPRGDVSALRVINNTIKKGNLRNWQQALDILLAATIDPYVMICEDDIRWAPDAMPILLGEIARGIPWGAAGALSLYCPDRMARMIGPAPLRRGYHELSVGFKMWGAQCLLFRREDAHLVASSPFFRSKCADPKVDKNVDGWVAETLQRHGRTILYRIPCLVDHELGDRNSSLYGEKERPLLTASNFAGL